MKILSNLPLPIGLGTGNSEDRIISSISQGIHGIESIIEYNGLYMNVREWIDTFIVESIMGIDDVDVRDSREINPGQHGETPGDAWYGGRTIVLQGWIETRTLWKLRDMQQALRMAFSDISKERPLILHTRDSIYDVKIFCKKKSKIEMPEQQDTLNYFKRNFNITLAASNPRFVSVQEVFEAAELGAFNGIAFNLSNAGTSKALPIIEIKGPLDSTIEIINEANNNYIKLNAAPDPILSAETLAYDFRNQLPRLYLAGSGESRFKLLDPVSTNFSLERGDNPIHIISNEPFNDYSISFRYNHTYGLE